MFYRYVKSLFLLTFLASFAYAGAPGSITYQGRLKESGQPISNTRKMRFNIYKDGALAWYSPDLSVVVSSGMFSVEITPAVDWTTGTDWYIETIIGWPNPDKTLSPREKITSQFFALHAKSSEDLEQPAGNSIHFAIGGSTVATITSAGNFGLTPPGVVVAYMGATIPNGWLSCDGSTVTITQYQGLYSAIGYKYGGSGVNFVLPNLNGMFLRGYSTNSVVDPEGPRLVGSTQIDSFQGHHHSPAMSVNANTTGVGPSYILPTATGGGPFAGVPALDPCPDSSNGAPRAGPETRPKNIAVNYIIKY
jgi:microcystin-dependent protein